LSQPPELTPQTSDDTADADRACAEMKAHISSARRMVEQARRALTDAERRPAQPRSFQDDAAKDG
jgi:hypothetical protein